MSHKMPSLPTFEIPLQQQALALISILFLTLLFRFLLRRPESTLHIDKLVIHPIKSCRGISVPRARLLETGLEGDRGYALALREPMDDGSSGYTVWTQFEVQDLARFVTSLDDNDPSTFIVSVLRTHSPLAPPTLTLPFTPTPSSLSSLDLVHFRIGITEPTNVYDIGDAASDFFSRHLPPTGIPEGAQLRLIYKGPLRRELTGCAKGVYGSIRLQTVMPLLVTHQASWDDLAKRMEKAEKGETAGNIGSIDRFRGNIIMAGGKPWEEDHWRRLRITSQTPSGSRSESCTINVVGRCMRCVIVTVNPHTGLKSAVGEPLKTMSSFRRIDEGSKFKVAFGMHSVPELAPTKREEGIMLSVGDKVEVLKTGKHYYINGYVGHHESEPKPKRLVK